MLFSRCPHLLNPNLSLARFLGLKKFIGEVFLRNKSYLTDFCGRDHNEKEKKILSAISLEIIFIVVYFAKTVRIMSIS